MLSYFKTSWASAPQSNRIYPRQFRYPKGDLYKLFLRVVRRFSHSKSHPFPARRPGPLIRSSRFRRFSRGNCFISGAYPFRRPNTCKGKRLISDLCRSRGDVTQTHCVLCLVALLNELDSGQGWIPKLQWKR